MLMDDVSRREGVRSNTSRYPETLVLSFPPLSNRGTKGMMHTGDPWRCETGRMPPGGEPERRGG